jgi:hypothetical protein
MPGRYIIEFCLNTEFHEQEKGADLYNMHGAKLYVVRFVINDLRINYPPSELVRMIFDHAAKEYVFKDERVLCDACAAKEKELEALITETQEKSPPDQAAA